MRGDFCEWVRTGQLHGRLARLRRIRTHQLSSLVWRRPEAVPGIELHDAVDVTLTVSAGRMSAPVIWLGSRPSLTISSHV
jgi:hypothetical protein